MRKIKTTVTSNGATLYTMTIQTSHEKRNKNGGNIRWKDELKPSRNISKNKKHYYERF